MAQGLGGADSPWTLGVDMWGPMLFSHLQQKCCYNDISPSAFVTAWAQPLIHYPLDAGSSSSPAPGCKTAATAPDITCPSGCQALLAHIIFREQAHSQKTPSRLLLLADVNLRPPSGARVHGGQTGIVAIILDPGLGVGPFHQIVTARNEVWVPKWTDLTSAGPCPSQACSKHRGYC